MLCSFTYVVAQIYGIGLIASRLTGVQFEIGILLGLGGVLLCSFLGGMRAITWTQVAQYVVLLLAFLIPVSWLAYKQLGNPLAPLVLRHPAGQDRPAGGAPDAATRRRRRCRPSTCAAPNVPRLAAGRPGRAGARARRGAGTHPRLKAARRRLGPHRAAHRELRRAAARRAGAREQWTRARRKAWTGPGR
jgi:cation/acetate symporter